MPTLTSSQREGLRNRVGDIDSASYEISDVRLQQLYDEAFTAGEGNPLTRTIVMVLEELVGRASIKVSQQGDFGQQMNSDLFRRRTELLKTWREQLAAEIEAGVTTIGPGSGFGMKSPNAGSAGVFTFNMDEKDIY